MWTCKGRRAAGAGLPHQRRRLLTLSVLFALTAHAAAHDFSQSESTIEIAGHEVRVRLSLNLLEFPGVDTVRDGRVSYDELEDALERLFGLVKEHFTVSAPDPASRIVVDRHGIVDDHVLQMDLRYQFGHDVTRVEVQSTLDVLAGPTHQHFVTARIDGGWQRAVLDATNRSAHFNFDPSRVTPGRMLTVALAALGVGLLGFYRIRQARHHDV